VEHEPTRLQRELLPRVVDYIRHQGIGLGTRLTEMELARHLQVSRTPVRAVLEQLAEEGILDARPRRGFVLKSVPEPASAPDSPPNEVDELCLRIARDKMNNHLPPEISESDLMRRYDVTRPFLLRVLMQLAEVALVERKPGNGWAFLPSLEDASARQESYDFRLLIEPAAVLARGFALDPRWLEETRRQHEAFLATPWRETASIALFEMNAAFHEGLAAASGNRYILLAVRQQNRLRRFSNYDWVYGFERVQISCREHLEILDRLELGEREVAAALLRRHLEQARSLSRQFGE